MSFEQEIQKEVTMFPWVHNKHISNFWLVRLLLDMPTATPLHSPLP